MGDVRAQFASGSTEPNGSVNHFAPGDQRVREFGSINPAWPLCVGDWPRSLFLATARKRASDMRRKTFCGSRIKRQRRSGTRFGVLCQPLGRLKLVILRFSSPSRSGSNDVPRLAGGVRTGTPISPSSLAARAPAVRSQSRLPPARSASCRSGTSPRTAAGWHPRASPCSAWACLPGVEVECFQ